MHRLPRIAPQSIWLNGAPNCPPCEIWSTVSPFTTSGLMTVSTSMHDWSEVFGYSVPPPVTRHVTALLQVTEAEQLVALSSEMRLPVESNTHNFNVPSVSDASACAERASERPPGHVTGKHPRTIGPLLLPGSIWIGNTAGG